MTPELKRTLYPPAYCLGKGYPHLVSQTSAPHHTLRPPEKRLKSEYITLLSQQLLSAVIPPEQNKAFEVE